MTNPKKNEDLMLRVRYDSGAILVGLAIITGEGDTLVLLGGTSSLLVRRADGSLPLHVESVEVVPSCPVCGRIIPDDGGVSDDDGTVYCGFSHMAMGIGKPFIDIDPLMGGPITVYNPDGTIRTGNGTDFLLRDEDGGRTSMDNRNPEELPVRNQAGATVSRDLRH